MLFFSLLEMNLVLNWNPLKAKLRELFVCFGEFSRTATARERRELATLNFVSPVTTLTSDSGSWNLRCGSTELRSPWSEGY
jgi:hypothetical protein